MKLKSTLALTGIVLSIISCNNTKEEIPTNATESKSALSKENYLIRNDSIPLASVEDRQEPTKPGEANEAQKNGEKAPVTAQVDWDKKIIKSASLAAEVKVFREFSGTVKELSKKYGGYIASEEQEENEYKIQNRISIKVPVAQFEDLMYELDAGAARVTEKKVTSEDVTTALVDTRSRIEAKKQVREKYLEFLKQSKNMDEVLNVQSQVNGIQEELETAGGRVQYLAHSAAYSTINLTYFQILDAKAPVSTEPSFTGKAAIAFAKGWYFIMDILVGLLTIWPLMLSIAILWIVVRKNKLRSAVAETGNRVKP